MGRLLFASTFSLLCSTLASLGSCDIRARESFTAPNTLTCGFSVSDASSNSPCNTTLRQVFRLLSVGPSKVIIGSTECVYSLDADLSYRNSAAIALDNDGEAQCRFAFSPDKVEFRCKNYISYGYFSAGGYRVCGTFSSAETRCWMCTENNMKIMCGSGVPTVYMPRTPTQNFTVFKGATDFYIGGLKTHNANEHIFAKVDVNSAAVTSASVETDENKDQIMYENLNFVGKPIEHGDFVYFFFRERAKEYDNIGQIIYSRVGRICKNDLGGLTQPLIKQFTTYLKTRLTCSVGAVYPFHFNEIQDVKQGKEDNTTIYGLFTTPNAGTSSSAICRYSLMELETLFNTDFRRGQPSPTDSWQSISTITEDTPARRMCKAPYDSTIYDELKKYPLMNTNAPNCGFGSDCSSFQRDSDDALAIFEGVRGQKLAILADSVSDVHVFIGTNDKTILQASINATDAVITKKIMVQDKSFDTKPQEISDKWPYGVSYLDIHNGDVYGTLDNCAFRFTPNTNSIPTSKLIVDRTPNTAYNHSVNIPDAVTTVFKLFEAPGGTQMNASFADEFARQTCSQRRFTSDSSCREFLHVYCEVRGIPANQNGVITVSSLASTTSPLEVIVVINVDESQPADVSSNEITDYDYKLAEYVYKFRKWVKDSVSCQGGTKSTCPNSADCCGNC